MAYLITCLLTYLLTYLLLLPLPLPLLLLLLLLPLLYRPAEPNTAHRCSDHAPLVRPLFGSSNVFVYHPDAGERPAALQRTH
jgi:hypothetical protein